MAWPMSGTWDGASVESLGAIMSALIFGINQRLEALAQSPLEFWYGDGTTKKTYPTESDFDGFRLANHYYLSADNTKIGANMTLIQQGIEKLVDGLKSGGGDNNETIAFVTEDEGTTEWTETTLLADVDLGEFPETYTTWLNATDWLRFKECLDRLIYAKINLRFQNWVDGNKKQFDDGESRPASNVPVIPYIDQDYADEVYEDAYSASSQDGNGRTLFKVTYILQRWQEQPLPPTYTYAWYVQGLIYEGSARSYFCDYGGTVSKLLIDGIEGASAADETAHTITLAEEEITLSGLSASPDQLTFSSISRESDGSLLIPWEWEPPETLPYDADGYTGSASPGEWTSLLLAGFTYDEPILWIDLTSDLTDQAEES